MNYIAYYRVSTTKQELSHLSLDAQRDTVLRYIKNNGNKLVGEYTEVESGRNNDRPQLNQAIKTVKKYEGTLVIAKLDRLSRNVKFITDLMESKVKFVCCDMPEATDLTIHIFAAIAQWEREQISRRTKEGLDAKRKREPNWKPGTNNLTEEGTLLGHAETSRKAREDKSVRHAYHFIKPLREKGLSYRKIAEMLNTEGYVTRTGKPFFAQQVMNVWNRLQE